MTTIGCTGHQTLSDATRRRIAAELAARIATIDDDVVGLSSLAAGADQVFAHVILASGGSLHVVIPCDGYAEAFADPGSQQAFRHLLAQAHEVTKLPFSEASEEAFMAAGRAIADRSDLVLAVWDGKPAAGLGGTADVVTHAKRQGTPVEIVWPVGARRS